MQSFDWVRELLRSSDETDCHLLWLTWNRESRYQWNLSMHNPGRNKNKHLTSMFQHMSKADLNNGAIFN